MRLEQPAGARIGQALPISFNSSSWGGGGDPVVLSQDGRQRLDCNRQGSVQRAAGGRETEVAACHWSREEPVHRQ